MVNDILWLHFPFFYKSDGTPVEGISYSQFTIESIADLVSQHRSAFGFVPAAALAYKDSLEKIAILHLASVDGSGILVDFGDSHPTGGVTVSTILSAAFERIISGNLSAPLSINVCQARKLNAAVYGSYGSDPWVVDSALAPLTAEFGRLMTECAHVVQQPLGPLAMELFPDGGYAALHVPLLAPNASAGAPCFGTLCVDQLKPSMADILPYAHLALQARDALWSKSELDFGTVIWSAWGQRLLSEFGYGAMSHVSDAGDYRRVEYLDNNPAGHNTVVVHEAFQTEDEGVINFSQLIGVPGELRVSNTTLREGDAGACLLLDGSTVYGSLRADGWLDVMRRYTCPVGAAFVLIDVLATKSAREPLVVPPGGNGGPGFDEGSTAHSRLHLEEYFHTDTAAVMQTSGTAMSPGGSSAASVGGVELPFNTAENPRASTCSHVDVTLRANSSEVLLQPRCGLMKGRPPDGLGLVVGFAAAGGWFEYDGLVTTEDVYFNAHGRKKRRFRFVGSDAVGTEGDVRAFVLAPSPAHNRSAAPLVRLSSCSEDVGCGAGAASPLACSCIEICVGRALHWALVTEGRLAALQLVGECDEESITANATLVDRIRHTTASGPWVPLPSTSPSPSPSPQPSPSLSTQPPPSSPSPSQCPVQCGHACPYPCQVYHEVTQTCVGAMSFQCPCMPPIPWCDTQGTQAAPSTQE